jgi:glycosyltransferase involved in cell wall biosynthesis
MTKRAPLYITYDGLMDPLGASQILPYLREIARNQGGAWVMSFEKLDRLGQGENLLRAQLLADGIHWHPLRFTAGGGLLGKVKDLVQMYGWGLYLAWRENLGMVHARGHPSAQVGLFIKRILGRPLIFDCRGLWVDERVDKGGWDLSRPFHRLQYRHFKRAEHRLFQQADRVVVLTHKVVGEVVKLGAQPATKVTVIPCCADFDHFALGSQATRLAAREQLGLPAQALVLGYLGSVGRMYMLDRFFKLLAMACERHPHAHALVITQDEPALRLIMQAHLPQAWHARVVVVSATRREVPTLLPAMDVLVSFITPTYARMGASPTKLAECFAAGVPAICNGGVGDVAEQIAMLNAGMVVNPDDDVALVNAAAHLPEVASLGGVRLREAASQMLGLDVAHARYRSIYSSLSRA